jgi:phosphoribosylformylglycinamidine cyclo-ligase
MCVVASADQAGAVAGILRQAGETVIELGRVTAGAGVTYKGTLSPE